MAEANPEENENDSLLAGLERGDLTSGIYEGGFKTWECSLDLASLLAGLRFNGELHVIELGAGSAVPSLTILQKALKQSLRSPIHFTLCDYNDDVLKLATAPNVFLASDFIQSKVGDDQDVDELEVEDIDEEKVLRCLQVFESAKISFDFISGAWGEAFLPLISRSDTITSDQQRSTLILASETIYSPKSTIAFADTLMQLLRQNPQHTKAWVAAKKVYFGVGGGVDDFVNQVMKVGGSVKRILDVHGAGVGRVVLEVTI